MNVQKSKFRKVHKPRLPLVKLEQKRILPFYGVFAIRSLTESRISFNRLDSARRTLKKVIKKSGNIWQIVFADQPVTSKPAEVRMGKGKGGFSHNVAMVVVGTTLFELGGSSLSFKVAQQAFVQASYKLGISIELVRRIY